MEPFVLFFLILSWKEQTESTALVYYIIIIILLLLLLFLFKHASLFVYVLEGDRKPPLRCCVGCIRFVVVASVWMFAIGRNTCACTAEPIRPVGRKGRAEGAQSAPRVFFFRSHFSPRDLCTYSANWGYHIGAFIRYYSFLRCCESLLFRPWHISLSLSLSTFFLFLCLAGIDSVMRGKQEKNPSLCTFINIHTHTHTHIYV